TPEESQELFDHLPSFTAIPAYICGFVSSNQSYPSLSYTGKKGKKHYTIESWCGPIEPSDLERIKIRENVMGDVKFLGIGSFSHDKGHLFNTENLMWTEECWHEVRANL
ncbi:MAG: hypothetical protein ACKO5Q_20245, partial [Microcystaceae cyanobacterium]